MGNLIQVTPITHWETLIVFQNLSCVAKVSSYIVNIVHVYG